MRISVMTEREYELSKRLWRACFPEDDEEFIDYYYKERTKPEYALGLFEDGSEAPAAMLHMLPYKMRFGGEEEDVCFVAGVCTRPNARRRGYCARLFDRAFDIMRERGFKACVLQPFDTRFYERFGFRTYAYRRVYRLSHECTKYVGRTDERIASDPAKLAELYSRFTERYDGYSVRDERYFESYIREFSLEGAYISAAPHGCCAGYFTGGDLIVYELFFDENAESDLLTKLLPAIEGEIELALPRDIDLASISAGIPRELIREVGVFPFCMLRPLNDDNIICGCEAYCLDRY